MDKFKYSNGRIAVFAKAPLLGQVKTRLAATIGDAKALELYQQLLDYIVDTLSVARLCSVDLWVTLEPNHSQWQYYKKSYALSICSQPDGNLGNRLTYVAEKTLADNDFVLLVGADCPFIDGAYVEKAIDALADAAVVVGPAMDGGYVLLGMSEYSPVLFENIDWGTDRVYAQTIERLNSLGWSYRVLDALSDIDREEDLVLLEGLF